MDEGLVHSASLLSDAPRLGSDYRPANFSGAFQGPVTLAQALQQSLNVPAVQVLEALGPDKLVSRLDNAGVRLALPTSPIRPLRWGRRAFGSSSWWPSTAR